MKRVFQHPEGPVTGKKYWRSLEEYSDSAEFKQWLDREFPDNASEFTDGQSRRSFLKLMGASMALAGIGSLAGCRRPEAYVVPLVKTPEWMVPGRALLYASAMPRRRGAQPLIVTTFDGRPVKIEGNNLYPQSNGGSSTFAQASILDLYDPDRSKTLIVEGVAKSNSEIKTILESLRNQLVASQGKDVLVLLDEANSPTQARLVRELQKQFPQINIAVYEPMMLAEQLNNAPKAIPRFEKADVILSLDCDFLNFDEGGLQSIKSFTDKRRVKNPGDPMNRLYVVENRYTNTGAVADHRLRLAASQVINFAATLAQKLGVAVPAVNGKPVPLLDLAANSFLNRWLTGLAKDLQANSGKAMIVAGAHQPALVHQIVAAINASVTAAPQAAVASAFTGLNIVQAAELIRSGKISTLIIAGGNPVYNAPNDLDWTNLQKKVASIGKVYRLGFHNDESSEKGLANIQLPMSHFLETWGDTLSEDGTLLSIQPMILPLFGGISTTQLLGALAGFAITDGPELVSETFKQVAGGDITSAWKKFVHDGFYSGARIAAPVAAGNVATVTPVPVQIDTVPLSPQSLELVIMADYKVDDGRYSNNGWMQELPDPITKNTWGNAALISQKTANDLNLKSVLEKGIYQSDVILIKANGKSLEAPILIVPGHADNSISLSVGYGRVASDAHGLRIASNLGANAYALRSSTNPYITTGVTVEKTGKRFDLAITQEHGSMEGRALVREGTVEDFVAVPDFAKHQGMDAHIPENISIHKNPYFENGQHSSIRPPVHQWGMAIDLNTCIGCNTCTIACQSENNIPIVGKEQVQNGREMHWLRIDRYFSSKRDASKIPLGSNLDEVIELDDTEMIFQPMACVHCENAPCETVCPVNATVHSEEGLNVMAYNRCIGTRYCANNCPYKVRRFNFFDYNKRPLDSLYLGPLADRPREDIEMMKLRSNPNVTVRMRGVMEKCTYCVQRIETAKIDQKVKAAASDNIKVPDQTITTACQQACPADAIVFGDISDPNSRVSEWKASGRDYSVLSYLNTKPRTSYLARLRNPNLMKEGAGFIMPDIDDVGKMSGGVGHHGGDHSAAHGHAPEGEHAHPTTPAVQPAGHRTPVQGGGNH